VALKLGKVKKWNLYWFLGHWRCSLLYQVFIIAALFRVRDLVLGYIQLLNFTYELGNMVFLVQEIFAL
jgi:hypothetical protein